MPKNIIQDMVKAKRAEKVVVKLKKIPQVDIRPELKPEPKIEYINDNNDEGGSRYGLWFIALFSIVFLLFAVSFLFSGAKITINPKTEDLVLNESLNAVKDSKDDNLSFDLTAISGEETKTVQGGEEKDVADSAKGTVLVYNTFSSSSQPLSVDTRLEGSNGKIYKTSTKVVVPGMNADGTPGSIEVGVYGAEAGEEYNSTPLDFKIFGFKNTPKYSKFYARSKGDITGGFKGKVRQISDADKTAALVELKDTLQTKLLKNITDQTPSGYILFKDAVFLDTDGGTIGTDSTDGQVPITLKGTLYGFLFEEAKLTTKIVTDNVDNYDKSEVYIPNIRDLTFSLTDKENISFKDITNINFNLSGPAKIVWKVDTDKIVTDLLGKRKSDFNQIMSQYTNIDSAESVVKPVWKGSFPDKIKDIKVIVNYPQ